jgi:hypothetical protein
MTLFHEEPSEHLDSRFTIACHDELVEGAKEVLREVASVVMTRGSYRSVRGLTSKPPRRRRRRDHSSLRHPSRASTDGMMLSLDTEGDDTR